MICMENPMILVVYLAITKYRLSCVWIQSQWIIRRLLLPSCWFIQPLLFRLLLFRRTTLFVAKSYTHSITERFTSPHHTSYEWIDNSSDRFADCFEPLAGILSHWIEFILYPFARAVAHVLRCFGPTYRLKSAFVSCRVPSQFALEHTSTLFRFLHLRLLWLLLLFGHGGVLILDTLGKILQ